MLERVNHLHHGEHSHAADGAAGIVRMLKTKCMLVAAYAILRLGIPTLLICCTYTYLRYKVVSTAYSTEYSSQYGIHHYT